MQVRPRSPLRYRAALALLHVGVSSEMLDCIVTT